MCDLRYSPLCFSAYICIVLFVIIFACFSGAIYEKNALIDLHFTPPIMALYNHFHCRDIFLVDNSTYLMSKIFVFVFYLDVISGLFCHDQSCDLSHIFITISTFINARFLDRKLYYQCVDSSHDYNLSSNFFSIEYARNYPLYNLISQRLICVGNLILYFYHGSMKLCSSPFISSYFFSLISLSSTLKIFYFAVMFYERYFCLNINCE